MTKEPTGGQCEREAVTRRMLLRGLCVSPALALGCDGRGQPSSAAPVDAPRPAAATEPAGATTMRGLSIADYVSELSELKLSEIARPRPGPGQVLVRVRAVALNPVDVAIAKGSLRKVAALSFPAVLGWDLSGEVTELGEGVAGFTLDQAVYAGLGFAGGAFAQYAVVDVDKLAAAPRGLSHLQRAALPLVACTTVQAIAKTEFTKGSKVLVLGGAGGVGSIAVQWLRYQGAGRVVSTASATKLETVRGLGAEVIDYRAEDWSERLAGAGFDVVYDTVGDDNAPARAKKVLRDGGHYIAIAGRLGDTSALGKEHRFEFFVTHPSGEDLAKVTRAVDEGGVTPLVFKEFAFDEIADAYALCAERVAVGKIVVSV